MRKNKKRLAAAVALALSLSFFSACSDREIPCGIDDGGIPLTSGISGSGLETAVASGEKTQTAEKAVLDYSNTADGYVMLKYTGTNAKVKTRITGPDGAACFYDQSLTGDWDVYPLTGGDGTYTVRVYENISGVSYAAVFSFSFEAVLRDEFAPFLIPNKYVNYGASSKAVAKAFELCANDTSVLEKISSVYGYVISNFTYDYELAQTVKSGYIPDLDAVMDKGSGICFDYAALMTAMLRCQSIPTKLVFGYTGSVYHAWISVYSAESGWIDAAIYFDGLEWKLMDPTFASTCGSSGWIMEYIGNSDNYTAKYLN